MFCYSACIAITHCELVVFNTWLVVVFLNGLDFHVCPFVFIYPSGFITNSLHMTHKTQNMNHLTMFSVRPFSIINLKWLQKVFSLKKYNIYSKGCSFSLWFLNIDLIFRAPSYCVSWFHLVSVGLEGNSGVLWFLSTTWMYLFHQTGRQALFRNLTCWKLNQLLDYVEKQLQNVLFFSGRLSAAALEVNIFLFIEN